MYGIDPDIQPLVEQARLARERAHAVHSGFRVGAALEDAEGGVWTGCNVESSSYGLSLCAERVALAKALSEGAFEFRRMAVVAESDRVVYPCGGCLQLLADYAPGIRLILHNPATDETRVHRLAELLPYPFSQEALNKAAGK